MSSSADNDAARFEALYREHYPAVLRYAARRTDPASAEEIAAETFATAWQRLPQLSHGDALPWLLVTARNTLANLRLRAGGARNVSRCRRGSPALSGVAGQDPSLRTTW